MKRKHRRWQPDDNPTTVHGVPDCARPDRFNCRCCGNNVCWCRGCHADDHTAHWCDWCAVYCTPKSQKCQDPPLYFREGQ